MSDVATVFVSGIRSLDADALLSAFNMEPSLLDANINAISSLFGREIHLMNAHDMVYTRLSAMPVARVTAGNSKCS